MTAAPPPFAHSNKFNVRATRQQLSKSIHTYAPSPVSLCDTAELLISGCTGNCKPAPSTIHSSNVAQSPSPSPAFPGNATQQSLQSTPTHRQLRQLRCEWQHRERRAAQHAARRSVLCAVRAHVLHHQPQALAQRAARRRKPLLVHDRHPLTRDGVGGRVEALHPSLGRRLQRGRADAAQLEQLECARTWAGKVNLHTHAAPPGAERRAVPILEGKAEGLRRVAWPASAGQPARRSATRLTSALDVRPKELMGGQQGALIGKQQGALMGGQSGRSDGRPKEGVLMGEPRTF
eukprot:356472-Chlamydomonas_euryale.AAC.3